MWPKLSNSPTWRAGPGRDLRTMHLFAGAGGGLLADLILGHTPIAAVEWDAYCCQVLRERAEEWFPCLRVHEGDVRLFDPSEYAGRVDCIHAGFPCQDLSLAGRQAGIGEDTRSGLYREVLRIADALGWPDLFLENVAAILGNGLGVVLGDLAARGYDCRWTCVRASDVGAPHIRDRWWLLAHRKNIGSQKRDAGTLQRRAVTGGASFQPERCGLKVAHAERDAIEGQQPRSTDAEEWPQPGTGQAGPRRDGVRGWFAEPDVGRVANGVASRVDRLKALGNGQVPLQAALAWKILTGG
jgi:DNA (cytosine-5)-methyltransferase 1